MIVGSNKTVRALGAIARSQEGRTLIEWLEQELAVLDRKARRADLATVQVLQGQALFAERILAELEKARGV